MFYCVAVVNDLPLMPTEVETIAGIFVIDRICVIFHFHAQMANKCGYRHRSTSGTALHCRWHPMTAFCSYVTCQDVAHLDAHARTSALKFNISSFGIN